MDNSTLIKLLESIKIRYGLNGSDVSVINLAINAIESSEHRDDNLDAMVYELSGITKQIQ